MATTAQEWQESKNDNKPLYPEPDITYDHMSDAGHSRYFRTGNQVTAMTFAGLLIESVLIAGMMAALIILSW